MNERPNELKTVDTATAIEASTTWRRLGDLIPTIELYLIPRRGKSEVRMPPGSKLPLDVIASDLLLELDQACDFYIAALMFETPDITRFPDTLSERLHLVGQRYGHFTTTTETRTGRIKGPNGKWRKTDDGEYVIETRTLGLDYCDEAEQFLTRVAALISIPIPAKWLGPCPMCDNGALWLKAGNLAIRCDTCKAAIDEDLWRDNLWRALESRLMEANQIAPAIRLLGGKCTASTVRSWIHRRKLLPVLADSELYRFIDAVDLAHLSPRVSLDKDAATG